jgi:hypothetical protein
LPSLKFLTNETKGMIVIIFTLYNNSNIHASFYPKLLINDILILIIVFHSPSKIYSNN